VWEFVCLTSGIVCEFVCLTSGIVWEFVCLISGINITASPCETNSYNDIIDSPCLILIIRIRNKTDEQNKNHTHTPLKHWIKPKSIIQDRKTRYQKLDTRTPTQYRKLDTRTRTQYRKLDTRTPTQYRKLDITSQLYFHITRYVLKRRREDTFWGAKSESRVSAPFFASKTV
jgi:hypothetical protein